MNNKYIYLSGGGNENQSFPLDKFFFSTLPKNGRFLYIPIALRKHKLYATARPWMDSVLRLHNRTDMQLEIADNLSKYKLDDLKFFDGVLIGGGNTWNLMQEFIKSKFSNILIQYIEEGGKVYGGSAGAIILGKNIDTQDDKNQSGLKDVSGLNMLYNYSVACHFKDANDDHFKIWAINNNIPIICLPEETGLIIENGIALCVGLNPCFIYHTNGTRIIINPEESFKL